MTHEIPVVSGRPLLGNLREFKQDRIGLLTRIPREYGKIARIQIGALGNAVVITAPELCRELLVDHEPKLTKSLGLTLFARPMLGNGLLTADRDLNKRQRRMMAPAFMPKRIAQYADTIVHYSQRCVERLSPRHGSEVELCGEMMHLTLEIVGQALFGAELGKEAHAVGDALTTALHCINGQLNAAVPLPPQVPSPSNLRLKRSVRTLDAVVYGMIRERRASGHDTGDLLSMLLLAQDQDDGGVMTDRQVRDEAMTIMLAGHETTANALSWAFYLLAQNPKIRARLERELDETLAGRAASIADVPRLPYTLQVLKEAMRMYPPAYMFVRRVDQPFELAGHPLERNQIVIVNTVGLHYDDRLYPAPHTFDPDRFSAEQERSRDKYAYLPFGAGSRVCIGNHFALMEGQLALAQLAQSLRFELANKEQRAELETLMVLRPKGGLRMRVQRRSPAELHGTIAL